MIFAECLRDKSQEAGYNLNEKQICQLEEFYHMVVEYNKHMNLTSITEEEEFIDKHILDSFSASRMISFNNISKCIDIGTGAGFPGIPLKILYPDTEFVLIDSLRKRITFLNDVIDKLSLKNITAIHGRAEDLARDPIYREQFDLCVSRAVASLPVLMEYCIPFVKIDGYFISYKSQKGLEEIKEADHCLKVLGSQVERIEKFSISEMAAERLLIMIKKNKKTHHIYPRKSGIPAKKPL